MRITCRALRQRELFVIPKGWVVGDQPRVVMDGKDVDLLFRNYLINYPVISKNKFPNVGVVKFRDNPARQRSFWQAIDSVFDLLFL